MISNLVTLITSFANENPDWIDLIGKTNTYRWYKWCLIYDKNQPFDVRWRVDNLSLIARIYYSLIGTPFIESGKIIKRAKKELQIEGMINKPVDIFKYVLKSKLHASINLEEVEEEENPAVIFKHVLKGKPRASINLEEVEEENPVDIFKYVLKGKPHPSINLEEVEEENLGVDETEGDDVLDPVLLLIPKMNECLPGTYTLAESRNGTLTLLLRGTGEIYSHFVGKTKEGHYFLEDSSPEEKKTAYQTLETLAFEFSQQFDSEKQMNLVKLE